MTTLRERLRSRRPLWAIYPTRRLAAVVLAGALLWFLPGVIGSAVSIAAVACVVAAVAIDYLRLPGRRSLDVQRTVGATIGLGDRETVAYVVSSKWNYNSNIVLYDDLPPSIDVERASPAMVLEPGANVAFEKPFVATRRGPLAFGEIALRATTALGLLARIAVFDRATTTVVVPSFSNVRRFRLLAMQNRLSEAGIRALKLRGEGSAFAGLRDYVPGDDPRMLDWKATARHTRLITRENTVERSQIVLSLVDCGRAMTQLAGRFSRMEHVLSAALVLSDVAATGGDRVGLIAFDDTVRAYVPPQKGVAGIRSLRTALSGLDATLTEPDYATAFRLIATQQRRRALIVFFTDVIDVRTARSFIALTGRTARRHLIVVVAIQNDALIAAAQPSVEGSLALFRSAAAEELVREREEALTRMRRAGIAVLDVSAGQMATAVINRYLEIKARGLL